MRKAGWKRITGILFAAALLSGCAKQTYVEVTTAEETTVAATSAEIHIETATTEAEKVDPDQPPYYLPEERVEENGLIRSYLTGEMTDAAKANRSPVAVIVSPSVLKEVETIQKNGKSIKMDMAASNR